MKAKSSVNRKTRIFFDLADELNSDELRQFNQAATEAGAKSLTEHFLNITLRLPGQSAPPAPKKAA